MIEKTINFLSILKRKFKYQKKSYSFNGVDLNIDYIFKTKKNGFYLDIGAQHPISNNNTYLLFKKGWSGINIDINEFSIDLFNYLRPNDENIQIAISDKRGEIIFYYQ